MLYRNSVFIAILILAGILCTAGTLLPGDHMVNIGTHALHVRIKGQGSPTIVFEGGIGSRAEEWYALQDTLASRTRVVVYDRAGYGSSEPGPLPRDSGREVQELKALLDSCQISGPLVLVGHSLGALNVQVFASRYPEVTAGLVLLDPPPLEWIRGKGFDDLRKMADQMTNEWQDKAARNDTSSDSRLKAEAAFFSTIASEHREMFGSSARLVAAIKTFDDIPLTVIASGKPNPMFGEVAEEFQKFWINQSRALAQKSAYGKFFLAEHSSHLLHKEATELVLSCIVSMVKDTENR